MFIDVKEIISRLSAGEVVAVPTDTVYGLAVNPRVAGSLERLYALKGRAEEKKIPLLLPDMPHSAVLAGAAGASWVEIEKLAERCWPGPLTLVVPARKNVSADLLGEGGTIAMRVPACPPLLELLKKTGPLAVTSANKSGKTPALSGKEVEKVFGADFPILEGSYQPSGKPSTILRYEEKGWVLLREGTMSRDKLRDLGIVS